MDWAAWGTTMVPDCWMPRSLAIALVSFAPDKYTGAACSSASKASTSPRRQLSSARKMACRRARRVAGSLDGPACETASDDATPVTLSLPLVAALPLGKVTSTLPPTAVLTVPAPLAATLTVTSTLPAAAAVAAAAEERYLPALRRQTYHSWQDSVSWQLEGPRCCDLRWAARRRACARQISSLEPG